MEWFRSLGIALLLLCNTVQAWSIPPAPVMSYKTDGLNITASWSEVPNALRYSLYYARYPYAGPGTISRIDMGSQRSLSIDLWVGAAYYIAVTASDGSGESGYSNIEQFTITTKVKSLSACSGNSVFSQSPVAVNSLGWIIPLGNINGRESHLLPTDHMYFVAKRPFDSATDIDVVAPGRMVITSVTLQTNERADKVTLTDFDITAIACSDVLTRFAHILSLSPEILSNIGSFDGTCKPPYVLDGNTYRQCRKEVEIPVAAGEKIGTVGKQNDWTLDVFAYDARINLPFVAPEKSFGDPVTNENHAVCFLDYLAGPDAEALRNILGRGETRRTIEPVCGQLMQDIVNTAQGRWYVSGWPSQLSSNQALALVHDNVDPTIAVISVGGMIPTLPLGAYSFRPVVSGNVNADFNRVTADSTIYCYEPLASNTPDQYLYNFHDPAFVYSKTGMHVLIQMQSADKLLIAGASGSSCGSVVSMPSDATLFTR